MGSVSVLHSCWNKKESYCLHHQHYITRADRTSTNTKRNHYIIKITSLASQINAEPTAGKTASPHQFAWIQKHMCHKDCIINTTAIAKRCCAEWCCNRMMLLEWFCLIDVCRIILIWWNSNPVLMNKLLWYQHTSLMLQEWFWLIESMQTGATRKMLTG